MASVSPSLKPTKRTETTPLGAFEILPPELLLLILYELEPKDVRALSIASLGLWRACVRFRDVHSCERCGRYADDQMEVIRDHDNFIWLCPRCVKYHAWQCESCGWHDVRPHMAACAWAICDRLDPEDRQVHWLGNCRHNNCGACSAPIHSYTDAFHPSDQTRKKYNISNQDVVCYECGKDELLPYTHEDVPDEFGWRDMSGGEWDSRFSDRGSDYTTMAPWLDPRGCRYRDKKEAVFAPVCDFCDAELSSYVGSYIDNYGILQCANCAKPDIEDGTAEEEISEMERYTLDHYDSVLRLDVVDAVADTTKV